MKSPRIVSFAAFLSCVIPPGCSEPVPAKFNSGAGLYEKSVLVVPFSERGSYRWYGESEKGLWVAESLKSWARENWEVDFPEGEEVEKVLAAVRDWPTSTPISNQDWKKLTGSLGVECVVVGEIQKLELKNPRSIGIVDASVVAKYRVIDVTTGKSLYQPREKVVLYGNPQKIEVPTLDMGADLKLIERQLLDKLGQEIGKDLYGYYPD